MTQLTGPARARDEASVDEEVSESDEARAGCAKHVARRAARGAASRARRRALVTAPRAQEMPPPEKSSRRNQEGLKLRTSYLTREGDARRPSAWAALLRPLPPAEAFCRGTRGTGACHATHPWSLGSTRTPPQPRGRPGGPPAHTGTCRASCQSRRCQAVGLRNRESGERKSDALNTQHTEIPL